MSSAVPVPPWAVSLPVHSQTSGGPDAVGGGPPPGGPAPAGVQVLAAAARADVRGAVGLRVDGTAGGHHLGDVAAADRVAALVGVDVPADHQVDVVAVEQALPHRADPALRGVRGD